MHLTKTVYIGESKADGQFKILKTFADVYGEAAPEWALSKPKR